MKYLSCFSLVFILMASISQLFAKTVCSMTFNSSNEREVFKKHLLPLGYEFIELVPTNKDPNWLLKQCEKVKRCDVLLVSGHFGGLFFGEQLSTTLSLQEIARHSQNPICDGILKKPHSVFLMGCNTLSQKTPDHRSVNDYLRVLVGDGFPLNLAEEVAASRYLDFGISLSDQMMSLFSSSKNLIGFESTGPLGAQAAPLLDQAFKKSSKFVKIEKGIDLNELKKSFKSTNLRVIIPVKNQIDEIKKNILSQKKVVSEKAWIELLSRYSIVKNFNFLVEHKSNVNLLNVLAQNPILLKNVSDAFNLVYNQALGLSHIQANVLKTLVQFGSLDQYEYEEAMREIILNITQKKLDYVSADQLCTMLKNNSELGLLNSLSFESMENLISSQYFSYMKICNGEKTLIQKSKSLQCLINKEKHDWACLTDHESDLSIDACKLAKSRNSDPENADDMMWFCYSKMLDYKQLKQVSCMELTHQFSLLGNQIKMNWNCTNMIKNF